MIYALPTLVSICPIPQFANAYTLHATACTHIVCSAACLYCKPLCNCILQYTYDCQLQLQSGVCDSDSYGYAVQMLLWMCCGAASSFMESACMLCALTCCHVQPLVAMCNVSKLTRTHTLGTLACGKSCHAFIWFDIICKTQFGKPAEACPAKGQ